MKLKILRRCIGVPSRRGPLQTSLAAMTVRTHRKILRVKAAQDDLVPSVRAFVESHPSAKNALGWGTLVQKVTTSQRGLGR